MRTLVLCFFIDRNNECMPVLWLEIEGLYRSHLSFHLAASSCCEFDVSSSPSFSNGIIHLILILLNQSLPLETGALKASLYPSSSNCSALFLFVTHHDSIGMTSLMFAQLSPIAEASSAKIKVLTTLCASYPNGEGNVCSTNIAMVPSSRFSDYERREGSQERQGKD